MAQFLIRIVNHFASEIITKRLANSRSFQQFAMRTHLKVEQTKKIVEDPKEAEKFLRDTLEQGAGAGEKVKAEAGSVAASFERFKAALKEEVSRDFGGGTGANASSTTPGVRNPNARPNARRKRK